MIITWIYPVVTVYPSLFILQIYSEGLTISRPHIKPWRYDGQQNVHSLKSSMEEATGKQFP